MVGSNFALELRDGNCSSGAELEDRMGELHNGIKRGPLTEKALGGGHT